MQRMVMDINALRVLQLMSMHYWMNLAIEPIFVAHISLSSSSLCPTQYVKRYLTNHFNFDVVLRAYAYERFRVRLIVRASSFLKNIQKKNMREHWFCHENPILHHYQFIELNICFEIFCCNRRQRHASCIFNENQFPSSFLNIIPFRLCPGRIQC